MDKPVMICTQMPEPEGGDLFGPSRGIVSRGNLWAPGQVISIRFLDGDYNLHLKVKEYAEEWLKYANLEFRWVDSGRESLIRISFKEGAGSWCYVALDCMLIAKDEPTMNFGWLNWAIENDNLEEARRVILHEFGHMLGLQHEQGNPANNIPWNEAALLEHNPGWTVEQVKRIYTSTYKPDDYMNTTYDPDSIMHYAVDNRFTHGDFSVSYSYDLSAQDIAFVRDLYPGK